ncbi:uncharacterized protein LOC133787597 [Humulus lupulus]|uniref:uncharacterized protein LOC133787597 n=1 Tax=Humulus lupulus TaxID=3486 RepID=UPI002B40D83D|nr:uncharacterized protein LOC133787597 [Humulus lupulus]
MAPPMRKRAWSSFDQAVLGVWQREVGELSSRTFAHRLGASKDFVLRLDVYKKLEKHRGCVNTVSFNEAGDILVSGSDDRQIILWNWERGKIKLSFQSGHTNNVFQANFMPYASDRSIVTCAADGEVRHVQISESGKVDTFVLAKHHGRAHKLAIDSWSSNIFYSCGEDGLVQHFDLRTRGATELFTCRPIDSRMYMQVISLNAIATDPRNPNFFAVGGADEFTRLYDIRKYKWDGSSEFGQPANYFCPPQLIDNDQVGITGLAFSEQSELLVSYSDENIYLFTREMGLGNNPLPSSPVSSTSAVDTDEKASSAADTDENAAPQAYIGHKNCVTVKGVNFLGPNCDYVVSGSDCGRIFIWKKKGGELIRVMEADQYIVNCIESHPHIMTLASSGIEHNIKIWTPKALERAELPTNVDQVMPHRLCWTLSNEDDDSSDYYYDEDEDDHDEDDDEDCDDGDNDSDSDSDDSGFKENDDESNNMMI